MTAMPMGLRVRWALVYLVRLARRHVLRCPVSRIGLCSDMVYYLCNCLNDFEECQVIVDNSNGYRSRVCQVVVEGHCPMVEQT